MLRSFPSNAMSMISFNMKILQIAMFLVDIVSSLIDTLNKDSKKLGSDIGYI